MKKKLFLFGALLLGLTFFTTTTISGQEVFTIWNALPPGENEGVTQPECVLYRPAEKVNDSCIIICPGGGYNRIAGDKEGLTIAKFFNSKGMTSVVLNYRVPRREGWPKHLAAWQDAQRTVRFVRSHAKDWGINPEKIGIMGFSAGGHLSLMTATSSLTPSYEPVDELDKLSASVQFAVPVYPAYVLKDGDNQPNTGGGNDSSLVEDFAFDKATPPMCLIHGDADAYSPMNSVAIYHQLRKMNIPAEIHIFAKVGHGFGALPTDDHVGDWLNRVWAWLCVMGYGK